LNDPSTVKEQPSARESIDHHASVTNERMQRNGVAPLTWAVATATDGLDRLISHAGNHQLTLSWIGQDHSAVAQLTHRR
jgi:hypothetical protein